ncbi:MAG TPA: nickel/cobalt transporter [Xanthobacteraceae bacterium]
MTASRRPRRNELGSIALATAGLLLAQAGAAFAARSPFGIATPDTSGSAFTGPLGTLFAWVAFYQSAFYRALTDALAGVKDSGHAFYLLGGISLLYGVFHAVGPGHGKAVITSYLLVSRQTVRRGIVISFAAALMQGLVAIGIVLIAAVGLHVTAIGMTRATDWLEIISYALIAAVGAWLLWSKATGRGHHHHHHADPAPAHAGCHDHHHHDHDHHAHPPVAHAGATHDHADGDDCDHAGHSHAPDPRLLSQPLTPSRAWTAIVAVGVRPCTGAIIVLVFAMSQKLLLAGIGSVLAMSLGTFVTVSALAILAVSAKDVALRLAGLDSVATERIMRVVEIGGALVVLLLGLTLLGGALEAGLPS